MAIVKVTPEGRKFYCEKEYTDAKEWLRAFPEMYGNLPAKVAQAFAKRDMEKATTVAPRTFTSQGDYSRAVRLNITVAYLDRHGWPVTDSQWSRLANSVEAEMANVADA